MIYAGCRQCVISVLELKSLVLVLESQLTSLCQTYLVIRPAPYDDIRLREICRNRGHTENVVINDTDQLITALRSHSIG